MQMDFYFEKFDKRENCHQRVFVRLTIDRDTKSLKFDVDFDSIPGNKLRGYEVIVDFTVKNFDNQQTFYTDSNGLEMQKRILNFRPSWNVTPDLEQN